MSDSGGYMGDRQAPKQEQVEQNEDLNVVPKADEQRHRHAKYTRLRTASL